MKKIILASNNAHKIEEIKKILEGLPFEIKSLKDENINIDIEEDGNTFEENAKKKASEIANFLKNRGEKEFIVMADDSGLEVDYLNGEPGIYSARYMGEDTSYHIKNANLIERLDGVEDEKRTARFVCVIAAVCPDGSEHVTRGTIEGRIGYEEKGENGFGYDPIFYVPEYHCYSAELAPEEKNKISHRGKALEEMKTVLMKEM